MPRPPANITDYRHVANLFMAVGNISFVLFLHSLDSQQSQRTVLTGTFSLFLLLGILLRTNPALGDTLYNRFFALPTRPLNAEQQEALFRQMDRVFLPLLRQPPREGIIRRIIDRSAQWFGSFFEMGRTDQANPSSKNPASPAA